MYCTVGPYVVRFFTVFLCVKNTLSSGKILTCTWICVGDLKVCKMFLFYGTVHCTVLQIVYQVLITFCYFLLLHSTVLHNIYTTDEGMRPTIALIPTLR
jgi:hypothetical protein